MPDRQPGRRYAEGTSVPVDRSRSEIERTVTRFGAEAFAYGVLKDRVMVEFIADDRRVRFLVELPDDYNYGSDKAYEAEVRRLWRSLLLSIKSKLEVVASGIATFEEEFLAHVVLPDGRMVGDAIGPAVADAYETGEFKGGMLALNPGGS